MKKLLAGCLIVLVLGAVVVGVGAYMMYRAASPLIEDARNYMEGMSKLSELDRNIENKSEYTPPATGELTELRERHAALVHERLAAAEALETVLRRIRP